MADDNSQDYEGYHRTSENNPGEEPTSASDEKDKDAPDLVDDTDDSSGSSGDGSGPGGQDGSADDDNNDNVQANDQQDASAVKDPNDWTTGDEPATAAQKSYISTMAVEAHEEVPFELTKAEASEKINELQKKTGRDPSTERP